MEAALYYFLWPTFFTADLKMLFLCEIIIDYQGSTYWHAVKAFPVQKKATTLIAQWVS